MSWLHPGVVALAVVVAVALHLLGAQRLLRGAAGFLGVAWLAVILAWWGSSARPGRLTRTLAVFLGIATFAFFALPKDWMGEFRFGTAVMVFFYLFTASVLADALAQRRAVAVGPAATVAAITLLVLVSMFGRRTWRFRQDPTVSLASTAASHQRTFERYARELRLGPGDASLLTPDLGGPLYFGSLGIHDLAGLCDPVIARTLGRDRGALHHHVFGVLKPEFIFVHSSWAWLAMLHEDPRFEADYLPIVSHEDVYVAQKHGVSVPSGHFVRRDLVADPAAAKKLYQPPKDRR
jgi:hypothetical protein